MLRHYFDHNATTPVASEVLDAYGKALLEVFGNPSSVHRTGQAARQQLDLARQQVARFVGARPREIVFVSGGTEANHLALRGVVAANGKVRPHVVTTAVEHAAMLEPCRQLERDGVAVTYLEVDRSGRVSPDEVEAALRAETVLVSVMHANNETGTIQPLAEIAAVTRAAGVTLHSDGVQAVGKVDVNLSALGVDLYSMSGHKLYGPKGVGALFVRDGVTLSPLFQGGRQESARRAGTENVTGALAFAAACTRVVREGAAEREAISELRDLLEAEVLRRVPDTAVNGNREWRLPNTTNLRFEGIEGESMVIALDLEGFAVSSGSACSSGSVEPSHVLIASGLTAEEARSSVRFSLGRSNTREQVLALVDAVQSRVQHLRRLSPRYPAYA